MTPAILESVFPEPPPEPPPDQHALMIAWAIVLGGCLVAVVACVVFALARVHAAQ
ncbi:MAG: hypothetical protein M3256_17845 [Actinomycetota bacterium]|nr:hypothetical protein [Actinomycetota bacterium]